MAGIEPTRQKKRDLMRVLRYQLRSHRNFKKRWDAPIILSTEFLEVAFIVIQRLKKLKSAQLEASVSKYLLTNSILIGITCISLRIWNVTFLPFQL